MKEERIKILRMVAEGKITPEEGEQLLDALDGGKHEKTRPDSSPTTKSLFEKTFENMFSLKWPFEEETPFENMDGDMKWPFGHEGPFGEKLNGNRKDTP